LAPGASVGQRDGLSHTREINFYCPPLSNAGHGKKVQPAKKPRTGFRFFGRGGKFEYQKITEQKLGVSETSPPKNTSALDGGNKQKKTQKKPHHQIRGFRYYVQHRGENKIVRLKPSTPFLKKTRRPVIFTYGCQAPPSLKGGGFTRKFSHIGKKKQQGGKLQKKHVQMAGWENIKQLLGVGSAGSWEGKEQGERSRFFSREKRPG